MHNFCGVIETSIKEYKLKKRLREWCNGLTQIRKWSYERALEHPFMCVGNQKKSIWKIDERSSTVTIYFIIILFKWLIDYVKDMLHRTKKENR